MGLCRRLFDWQGVPLRQAQGRLCTHVVPAYGGHWFSHVFQCVRRGGLVQGHAPTSRESSTSIEDGDGEVGRGWRGSWAGGRD